MDSMINSITGTRERLPYKQEATGSSPVAPTTPSTTYNESSGPEHLPDPTVRSASVTYLCPGLYWWVRDKDETGMSGVGRVAQVAIFEDGCAILRWLKDRNAAGVASTVFYETAEQLVHVHGHGDRRTGHLEPVFNVGEVVHWNCIEGFGGVAAITDVSEQRGIRVKMLPQHWTEHHYQPETWAYPGEVTRMVGRPKKEQA